MKKIICVFLAIILLIIPIISVTVYVENKSDILTSADFADKSSQEKMSPQVKYQEKSNKEKSI